MQNFSLNVYTALFNSCIDVFQEVNISIIPMHYIDRKKTCSHANFKSSKHKYYSYAL